MGDRADEITRFDPMDTRADAFATGSLSTPSGIAEGYPTIGADSGMELDSELSDDTGDDDIEATRAQIEQTRAELGSTIDAIQQRLNPQALAEQAKDTVREATIGKAETMISNAGDAAVGAVSNVGDNAKGFGDTLLTTVKQNPVPAALAGLGLGWLLMSGRKQSSQGNGHGNGAYRGYQASGRYDYGDRGMYGAQQSGPYSDSSGMQNAASRVAGRVGDTTGQAVSDVQDAAGNVAGQVQDLTGNMVGQVQDTASQIGYQAQVQTQRVSGSFQDMLQTRPLALAASSLAIGLAVGLAIPETPQEDRLMGPVRENLMEQAQHTAHDTAQKAQTVAEQAVDAAKVGARKENLL